MSLKATKISLMNSAARRHRRQEAPKLATTTTSQLSKVDPQLLDKSLIETCLPAHMLFLMCRAVRAEGYEFRKDMQQRLNEGAAAPLAVIAGQNERISKIAKEVDRLAQRVLNALAPDNQAGGMYAVAYFILRLVEEKLYAETTNQGVLVSMLMMDDLKQEGGVEGYTLRQHLLKADADKMLVVVRKEGYFADTIAGTPDLDRGDMDL